MSTFPASGMLARFDSPEADWPPALDALPKPARRLQETLHKAGWQWLVQWGVDSASQAFVRVDGRRPAGPSRRALEVRAVWHTRATDGEALRLFSNLWRGYRSGGWTGAPSLAAVVAWIESA